MGNNNTNIVLQIQEWIQKYQPNLTEEKGTKLYSKLIKEEKDELEKAIYENNLKEIIDAIGDIFWVTVWFYHFANIEDTTYIFEETYLKIERYLDIDWKKESFLIDLIEAIAESNFSKSYEQQKNGEKQGKIIKWPNYKAPDIENIIKKYSAKIKDRRKSIIKKIYFLEEAIRKTENNIINKEYMDGWIIIFEEIRDNLYNLYKEIDQVNGIEDTIDYIKSIVDDNYTSFNINKLKEKDKEEISQNKWYYMISKEDYEKYPYCVEKFNNLDEIIDYIFK